MRLKLDITSPDFEAMIRDCKVAHTAYETANPQVDHADLWPTWYAGYLLARLDHLAYSQYLAGSATSASELSMADLVRAVGKFATGPTAPPTAPAKPSFSAPLSLEAEGNTSDSPRDDWEVWP